MDPIVPRAVSVALFTTTTVGFLVGGWVYYIPLQDYQKHDLTWFRAVLLMMILQSIFTSILSTVMLGIDMQRFNISPERPLLFCRPIDLIQNRTGYCRFVFIVFISVTDLIFFVTGRLAFAYLYGSSVQSIISSMLFLTLLFEMLIHRKAILLREWVSVGILIIGVVFSVLSAFFSPPEHAPQGGCGIGVLLAFISAFARALTVIIEDHCYRLYNYPPMKIASYSSMVNLGLLLLVVASRYDLAESIAMICAVCMRPTLLAIVILTTVTAAGFRLSNCLVMATCELYTKHSWQGSVGVVWAIEWMSRIRPFDTFGFLGVVLIVIAASSYSGTLQRQFPPRFDKSVTYGGCLKAAHRAPSPAASPPPNDDVPTEQEDRCVIPVYPSRMDFNANLCWCCEVIEEVSYEGDVSYDEEWTLSETDREAVQDADHNQTVRIDRSNSVRWPSEQEDIEVE